MNTKTGWYKCWYEHTDFIIKGRKQQMIGVILIRNIEVILNEIDIFEHDCLVEKKITACCKLPEDQLQYRFWIYPKSPVYQRLEKSKRILQYLKHLVLELFPDNSFIITKLSLFYSGENNFHEWLTMAKLFYRNILGEDYLLKLFNENGICIGFIEDAVQQLCKLEQFFKKENIDFPGDH